MAFTTLQSSGYRGTSIVAASDVAVNDSSKTLLIADFAEGAFLELLAIRIELSTTATVTNRTMAVRIEATAGPDILYELEVTSPTLAPSLSKTWQIAPGADDAIATPRQQVQMASGLHVYTGQQLVIEDSAAVDPAADDLIVHVIGRLFGVRSL